MNKNTSIILGGAILAIVIVGIMTIQQGEEQTPAVSAEPTASSTAQVTTLPAPDKSASEEPGQKAPGVFTERNSASIIDKVTKPEDEITRPAAMVTVPPKENTGDKPSVGQNTVETSVVAETPVEVSPEPVEPPLKNSVFYTNNGYLPSVLTIKVGETVTWVNNSGDLMWTASGDHTTHAEYPVYGGCIGSTFDACRGIPQGNSWQFMFDRVGTWHYHDHLNPTHTGTIVVE